MIEKVGHDGEADAFAEFETSVGDGGGEVGFSAAVCADDGDPALRVVGVAAGELVGLGEVGGGLTIELAALGVEAIEGEALETVAGHAADLLVGAVGGIVSGIGVEGDAMAGGELSDEAGGDAIEGGGVGGGDGDGGGGRCCRGG